MTRRTGNPPRAAAPGVESRVERVAAAAPTRDPVPDHHPQGARGPRAGGGGLHLAQRPPPTDRGTGARLSTPPKSALLPAA